MDRLVIFERVMSRYVQSHRKKLLMYFLMTWVITKKGLFRIIARFKRRFPFYSSRYLTARTASYLKDREQHVAKFVTENDGLVAEEDIQRVLNARSIRELIAMIEKNELSCETLVRVYSLRTSKISLGMNHIADIDLEAALVDAKAKDRLKDEVMESGQGKLPHLYGIPIALKDHITASHLLSTMGLQSRLVDQLEGVTHQTDYQRVWRGTPVSAKESKYGFEDAEIVRVLKNAGAVIICMTNTPVFCGHYITNNAVYGFAENPYDRRRTTGGSSGGSGGIVATRSVPLSIGSDLLGSIRMPSGWCGLYGFNPTSRRVSKSGAQGFELRYDCDTSKAIMPIFGPMGRCVDDVEDCMRVLFGNFSQDKQCVPMKFDDVSFNSQAKLRFGVVREDSAVGLGRFNLNLIEENVGKLEAAGYSVVTFELSDEFWRIEEISKKLFLGTQSRSFMLNELRGESSIASVEASVFANELPDAFRKFGRCVLQVIGEDIAANTLDCLGESTGIDYEGLVREREILRKKFYDYWQRLEIDALILPISHMWAPRRHEEAFAIGRFFGCLTNALELPCGTIPMRFAKEGDQGQEWKVLDRNRILKAMIDHNLHGIQGLPIGLQVATLPFEDEKCLKAMKLLEDLHQFHPHAM